jgi:hypothetical protein
MINEGSALRLWHSMLVVAWEYVFIICGEMWTTWAMMVCSGNPFSPIVADACLPVAVAQQ